MAILRPWQDLYYILETGVFYDITFYDRQNRITRTESGWISQKGLMGIRFNVIGDMFITEENIHYKDIRTFQET